LGAVMAFSVRTGGHSPPPFDSLNFSSSEGDSPANVPRNLAVFSEAVGIDPGRIVFAHQIHRDKIQLVTSSRLAPQEADAMIAAEPGLLLAITTADCLPILLLDPVRAVVAVAHAGWKGTVLRITRKVLRRLKGEFGTDPADLLVALGPAIGPCCYTVDDTVVVPFRRSFPCPEQFLRSCRSGAANESAPLEIRPPRAGYQRDGVGQNEDQSCGSAALRRAHSEYLLDITGANRYELMAEGVAERNIHDVGLCTACNPELFFSHRRDRGLTGRHIAVAGFRV
jgi:purine-nucleoside/S-methyl-5'-thioadenosine phosphorylase / adenosine deaminase